MIQTAPMKLAVPPEPETPPPASVPEPARGTSDRAYWIIAALILAAGFFLRIAPWAASPAPASTRRSNRDNVIKLDKVGLFSYPLICQLYIEDQRKPDAVTKLPPTRFFYIYASWM